MAGSPQISIRRATPDDAPAIAEVGRQIAKERIYSAVVDPWTAEEQRTYLQALSPREAVYVAVSDKDEVIGFQTVDLWMATVTSMAHVGQIGTFLLPDWRRCGVGTALFAVTKAFAQRAGYAKFVIQVRASNESALAFYRQLGFQQCGRLARQVRIDEKEDDEILMELLLPAGQ